MIRTAWIALVAIAIVGCSAACAFSDRDRRLIDQELAARGLNVYGDPPDTVYPMGSPLVGLDGTPIDRYDYILRRHPDLMSVIDAPEPARRGGSDVAPPPDRASPPPWGFQTHF